MPLLRFGTLLLLFLAGAATAQEEWWFDVEVILFDRNQALTDLEEQFEYADTLAPYSADYDLIRDTLAPNIRRLRQSLPRCDAPLSPLWQSAPDLDTLLSDYRQWRNQNPTLASANTQTPAAYSEAADQRLKALTTAEPAYADRGVATDSAAVSQVLPPVSASDIASYWLSFHGVDDVRPVTVPEVEFCHTAPVWFELTDGKWTRPQNEYVMPMPGEIPIVPEGIEWPSATFAHLLPGDARELNELSQRIRQTRGLTRLLHTAWRQQVAFGRDQAMTMRLIAGKNYGNDFTLSGNQRAPLTEQVSKADSTGESVALSTMERLEQRLAEPGIIDFDIMMTADPEKSQTQTSEQLTAGNTPIWQIDGGIKVFLRYINRVPYLHIDSELFYRQPVPLDTVDRTQSTSAPLPKYKLVSVPFSQLRRVISTQIHYFDHPLFGMIVEIRRYRKPQDDEEESQ